VLSAVFRLSPLPLFFFDQPPPQLTALVGGDGVQCTVENLREASEELEASCVPTGSLSRAHVYISHDQTQRNSMRRVASLPRQLTARGSFHSGEATRIDDNSPEAPWLHLSSGRHDDVDVGVVRVAMNRGNPWRRSTRIPTQLVHCGTCK
jgi:hypothetical protein